MESRNSPRSRGPGGNFVCAYDPDDRLASSMGERRRRTRATARPRSSKTVAGVTTTYLYDGLNLVRETTAGVNTDYVFGPSIDEPLAVYGSGAVSYLNADGMGSVVATNSTAGTVTHSSIFDAWGAVKGETGTRIHSFTYTGRETGEAGLHFYRARVMQPGAGRLTQEDPLGLGPSVYAYAFNDPARLLDPLGAAGEALDFSPDKGHHFFPRAEWGKVPDLSQEAKDIFDHTKTGGKVPTDIHYWNGPNGVHGQYSTATRELFDEFVKARGIDPTKMARAEAEEFIRTIINSRRGPIRRLLNPIRRWMRANRLRGKTFCFGPVDFGLAIAEMLLEDQEESQLDSDYIRWKYFHGPMPGGAAGEIY